MVLLMFVAGEVHVVSIGTHFRHLVTTCDQFPSLGEGTKLSAPGGTATYQGFPKEFSTSRSLPQALASRLSQEHLTV